ncbi:hypothetical protein [Dactylosporangium sp. CA-139066]|uniref:hypothetical protein n=1 Tax=Dactylosporangium sp. CA-139066 TaxID=3239930 RepID=UPI003D8AA5CF
MLQRVGGAFGASVLLVVVPAVVAFGSPAVAKAPSPGPSSSASANPNLGPSVSGIAMCTINDPQVTEVSGLVVTADGYVVINDSNVERSREKIFFLDQQCKQTRSVSYPSSAFDPEDLAIAKDGTLWVADVGDNTTLTGGSGNRRSSIALWSLAPGANTPVIHRLAYPDGRARDAEALLLDGDGRPVIITKDPVGEVYTLNEPLPANNANPAALTRAGSFKPQATGTSNPYGIVGTAVVTGAAMSPDGNRAVVRTMSDAYEFDVTDGDVIAAITTGTPRITPLPSEPQGEAIAYSEDGQDFLTVSDQPKATPILRYTRYQPPAAPSAAAAPQAQAPKANERSFLDSLSLRDITRIVMGIGLVGVLMVAVGVVAVVRSRRRRRALLVAGAAGPAGSGPGSSSTALTGPDATEAGAEAAAGAETMRPLKPDATQGKVEAEAGAETNQPQKSAPTGRDATEAGAEAAAGAETNQPQKSAPTGRDATEAGAEAAAGAETNRPEKPASVGVPPGSALQPGPAPADDAESEASDQETVALGSDSQETRPVAPAQKPGSAKPARQRSRPGAKGTSASDTGANAQT